MDIDGLFINYEQVGEGPDVVLLHGWGQNIEMMKPVADPFDEEFNIVIIDLPGYGASSEPTYVWSLEEYVDCVHTILESLDISNPILVGHSFGGRIGIIYASKYEDVWTKENIPNKGLTKGYWTNKKNKFKKRRFNKNKRYTKRPTS